MKLSSHRLFETKWKNEKGEQEEPRMQFYISVFYTQELVSPEPALQAALAHRGHLSRQGTFCIKGTVKAGTLA